MVRLYLVLLAASLLTAEIGGADAPWELEPPRGKAISPTQIELHWNEPTYPNGILKPYNVTCYVEKRGNTSIRVSTKDNTTTTITVSSLQPDTAYRCYVEAATYPPQGQDPQRYTTRSEPSSPIWTKPATELIYNSPNILGKT
ncbi:unnamed protein product [Taenia asiatica]|uniref:Fibronectin type-III domain-containing protein n=1 Tax=Taenia asiatica TaxID=60517 RepID=A0A0R3WEB8_TAEAS|nr:unnamed protein product [Taenia asiatica]